MKTRFERLFLKNLNNKIIFDKYEYYRKSVQSPEVDCELFLDIYKNLRNKKPISLREDFCGTFLVSCEWVKINNKHISHSVDLDPEPLKYGKENYYSKLTENQKKRMNLYLGNVLDPNYPKTDLITVLNFSYFTIRNRNSLIKYFKNCLKSLNKKGLLILDIFGGWGCQKPNNEMAKFKNFSYDWQQLSFDPVSNFANFQINYKLKGEKKRKKVFFYEWRLWTIPEIREMMKEAGFSESVVYWEGTDNSGGGNGVFRPVEVGEDCNTWIGYVVGIK